MKNLAVLFAVPLLLAGCNATMQSRGQQQDPSSACMGVITKYPYYASILKKISGNGSSAPTPEILADTTYPTQEEATTLKAYIFARNSCLADGNEFRRRTWPPEIRQLFEINQSQIEMELNKLAAGQTTYSESASNRFKLFNEYRQQVATLTPSLRAAQAAQQQAADAQFMQGMMLYQQSLPRPTPSINCTSRNSFGTVVTNCN